MKRGTKICVFQIPPDYVIIVIIAAARAGPDPGAARPRGGGGDFMSKVLVVGGGAREHALAWKLSRSFLVGKVFVAPGNPGMRADDGAIEPVDIAPTDIERLAAFAMNERLALTVVGPEAALAAGIADEFGKLGLPIFGPTAMAAEIESSKSFAKDLMKRHGIPTAGYEVFSAFDKAVAYLETKRPPYVIKADGLAQGKGVAVVRTLAEAETALCDMLLGGLFGDAGRTVVIEEYLEGREFSYMALVDGPNVYPLLPARDYKRAHDGDEGPNTGGMGGYAPVPDLSDKDAAFALDSIMKPAARAMADEGRPFKGVLYAGLIVTADGVKVIEFNARFGDPETGVVLPLMESDLFVVLRDFLEGREPAIAWGRGYCAGAVLASKGYPGKHGTGFEIGGLDALDKETCVFFSGVSETAEGGLAASGGRVMLAARRSGSLVLARNELYEELAKIKCENLFFRTDIAKQ